MATNLFEKVYNHFKAYYNNGYNLLKKLRDVYFGDPQDVNLQWQDPETGEIHNLVVPSYTKLKGNIESFINNIRSELPLVNVHPNSRLICSNGHDDNGLYIPDGYSYNASLIEVAELIPVREHVDNPETDRTPIEKEFLDFVFGNHDNYDHYPNFNILHIKTKPKPSGAKWFMWRGITSVPRCTYRAFIKVVSGKLYITTVGVLNPTNKWQLVEVHTGSNRVIWDEHRLDYCKEGDVLEYYFAYPTVLMGWVSLPKSIVTIKQLKTEW